MDDDKEKSIVEKMIDKINDVVENIATTASDALNHAMEPEPVKPDDVVIMPTAGDGLLADPMMPPMPVVIPKKKQKAPAKRAPAKIPPKKAAAKKATKESSKKAGKRAAKRTNKKTATKSGKKAKSSVGRKAVGKKTRAKR
jgi:hypothetical protein